MAPITKVDSLTIVAQREQERLNATLSGDLFKLSDILDDTLVYTHSTGAIDTKESYLKGIRDGLWDYRKMERFQERYVAHGDTVLAFYRLKLELMTAGTLKQVDSLAIAVWVRSDGRFRLAALHSSPGVVEKGRTYTELNLRG